MFVLAIAWVVDVIAFVLMRAFDVMPDSHLVRVLISIPPAVTLAFAFCVLLFALLVHLRIGFVMLYERLGSPFSVTHEKK